MRKLFIISLIILSYNSAYAYDTNMSPEMYRYYGTQQINTKDSKGNTIFKTPHYESYSDRNENVSEKIVAIYDKHAPEGTYGARYVLYTPIGHYVGHHKIMQASPNGYGYSPIWDGGADSQTPCFKSISEANAYYYPQWYK